MSKKPLAFIAGCFDGAPLHPGHLHILTEAKKLGYLVVAINSDAYVARKGPGRPLVSLKQRCEQLYNTGLVDEVVLICASPLEIILFLCPDFIVVGDDYTEDRVVGAEECKAWGGCVVIVPRIGGYSTTSQALEPVVGRYVNGPCCGGLGGYSSIEIDV